MGLNGSLCLFRFLVFPTSDCSRIRKVFAFSEFIFNKSWPVTPVEIIGSISRIQVEKSPEEFCAFISGRQISFVIWRELCKWIERKGCLNTCIFFSFCKRNAKEKILLLRCVEFHTCLNLKSWVYKGILNQPPLTLPHPHFDSRRSQKKRPIIWPQYNHILLTGEKLIGTCCPAVQRNKEINAATTSMW